MSLPQYLTVVAEISAKPGREDELKQLLLSVVEPTRAEAECIQYDPHVSTDGPANFVLYENWKDAAALQKHLASDHMREFFAKASELFAVPPRVLTYTRIA
jgi:quinol monooxygenase YgiN